MESMNTKQQLQDALKEAMRQRDDLRKRTLRLALAAIKLAEVEHGGELDESAVLGVLQKEIKSRRETIEGAQRAGRDDLIAEAEAEIAVLQEFLPPPLTPEALEALAREVIAEVGANSPREMGKVMAALMPRLQGRATGKEASQVVRRLLQGK
jgi:uncharacterized protein YqeY